MLFFDKKELKYILFLLIIVFFFFLIWQDLPHSRLLYNGQLNSTEVVNLRSYSRRYKFFENPALIHLPVKLNPGISISLCCIAPTGNILFVISLISGSDRILYSGNYFDSDMYKYKTEISSWKKGNQLYSSIYRYNDLFIKNREFLFVIKVRFTMQKILWRENDKTSSGTFYFQQKCIIAGILLMFMSAFYTYIHILRVLL